MGKLKSIFKESFAGTAGGLAAVSGALLLGLLGASSSLLLLGG